MQIAEVYIPKSTQQHGTITFYEYQVQFLNAPEHWLFLQTPTGSGKTLALISKVLLGNTPGGGMPSRNGVFLYPTNELIKDQLPSLKDLARKLGFHPRILDVSRFIREESEQDWRRRMLLDLLQDLHENRNSVLLLALNGQELDKLVSLESMPKGQLIFDVLNQISNAEIPCIICTNMDTLYLILQGKYKKSSQILNTLLNWRHIAVDEFHLYSGIELANLVYCLMLYYSFVCTDIKGDYWFAFSSATPSPVSRIFLESFPNDSQVITSRITSEVSGCTEMFHEIRHETEFHCHPRTTIFYQDSDLDFFRDFVVNLAIEQQIHSVEQYNVAMLVLVNSVAFCEALFQEVNKSFSSNPELQKVSVHRVHGLVPFRNRPEIRSLQRALLIGTRSIELGIDFDVPLLVFEANDEGSFFQRLGRGGRHGECLTHSFIPLTAMHQISQFETGDRVSFEVFASAIRRGLREEIIFEDFIFSEQGIKLLALLVHSLEPNRVRGFDRDAFEARKKIYTHLKNSFYVNTLQLPDLNVFARSLTPTIARALKRYTFARSSTIHFPALIQLGDLDPNWQLFSIYNLIKCDFDLNQFAEICHELRGLIPCSWKVTDSDLIPIVSNIARKRTIFPELIHSRDNKIEHGRFGQIFYANSGGHILTFDSNLDDRFSQKISRLLEQRILPFTRIPHDVDWRVPSIKEKNSDARIVIGESAYLASYILQQ